MHISTAYTNCYLNTIEEKVYDPPSCHLKLISLANELSKDEIEAATPALLEHWPNTYTLTKAVAEYLVKETEGKLPACIFRPAVGSY